MKCNNILILACLLIACNAATTDDSSTVDSENSPQETKDRTVLVDKVPELAEMVTSVDNLRLREKPGSDGKEVMRLPERSVVTPTGNVTDLKQTVSLRGFSYDEPWIEVKVDEKIMGWLYAGAIDLQPNTSKLADRLFEARCKRFFGKTATRLTTYRNSFDQIQNAQDLKDVYEAGMAIGSDASQAFDRRCRTAEISGDIDLLWVKAAFPGYSITTGPEHETMTFLININQFIEKAKQTPEKDDDAAFRFLKEIHGNFSLLLSFREWFEMTSQFGGVSKLGSGLHSKFLDQIEKLHEENNLFFEGFISDECNFLVQDIVSNTTGYQRGKDAVLAEIEKIKAKDYKILTIEQKTSIDKRISQFSDLAVNKIFVNEKVGIQ